MEKMSAGRGVGGFAISCEKLKGLPLDGFHFFHKVGGKLKGKR